MLVYKRRAAIEKYYAKDNSITNYYAMTTKLACRNVYIKRVFYTFDSMKFMTNKISSHHDSVDRPEPLLCQSPK